MNELGDFVNGPYLLAPLAAGMTICWESNSEAEAVVYYGVRGGPEQALTVRCTPGTPWQGQPLCLYRAALRGLQPGTQYAYRIVLVSGETREGSFRTLPENPDNVRLLTLSDTHLFHTSAALAAVLQAEPPDFILHAGDISLGTGFQKNQYEQNWFAPAQAFLSHTPVVYTAGNHDDGPFYEDYFLRGQQAAYSGDGTGHNLAFTYGNTRFIIMDSNPWGLYEMNAANAGLPLDEVGKERVTAALAWLEAELAGPAAVSAGWRVLVLHHPYTDEFTQKHIVRLAETGRVNLVLAGHLHYYLKGVSVRPEIGAQTVYITQGSAEAAGAELDCGAAGQRLLTEFPEVVARGESNYGCLTISGDTLRYTAYGFNAAAQPEVVDEVVLVPEAAQVVCRDVELSWDEAAGRLTLRGEAMNQGRGLAAVTLSLVDNGAVVVKNLFGPAGQERVIVLQAGERCRFTAEHPLTAGRHQLCCGEATLTVTVPAPVGLRLANLTVGVGSGAMADYALLRVEATNQQAVACRETVVVYLDGMPVQERTIELAPHSLQALELAVPIAKGGQYRLGVNHLPPLEVYIEGELCSTPLVRDKSGNGNHAYLRGTPRRIQTEQGAALVLTEYGDYLEIPETASLQVTDGYTGMVWANVARLAAPEEMGHNPLLQKGMSLGWGATYLLRMAVERSGGLKWGTCHGISEYSWQGGQVTLGQCVQYTAAFDKASGGTSYCDAQPVAAIAGIPADCELRQWPGTPLFVGYSYIGHVIPAIGRPKYFTHLPATIHQVRFYTSKLPAAAVAALQAQPGAAIQPESLAVWLDFAEIEVDGVHTTEWRRPAAFTPHYKAEQQQWRFTLLQAEAGVSGAARLTAHVEVSDDRETVKAAQTFVLDDGVTAAALTALPPAQYVRIRTEFQAAVGEQETTIPVLREYRLTAAAAGVSTVVQWGTRAAWERGVFSGAVGFVPPHRLRVFDEYTDVIHG